MYCAHKRKMTSSIETTDGWSGPSVTPVRVEEEWEKTDCGCPDCRQSQKYFAPDDATKHWNKWSCRKLAAQRTHAETKAKQRFLPEISMDGFKPASRAQIAEWRSWLSSSDASNAEENLKSTTKAALSAWADHKFDPVAMELHISGLWPADQKKLTESPMWTAYITYAKEQYELLKAYNTLKDAKADEELENAEAAYTSLVKHIGAHGNIILLKDMNRQHKQVSKEAPTEAPKLGRRAARKLRNISESSSGSITRLDLRANKVVTKQGYEVD